MTVELLHLDGGGHYRVGRSGELLLHNGRRLMAATLALGATPDGRAQPGRRGIQLAGEVPVRFAASRHGERSTVERVRLAAPLTPVG